MKRLFPFLVSLLLSINLISQTVVYYESFDSSSLQIVNYGSSSQHWTINNSRFNSGSQSYHVNPSYNNQVPSFRTSTFSTLGQNCVKLEFYHICSLSETYGAIIEISIDSGLTWLNVTNNYYYGNSDNYGILGNLFNTNSYPNWVRSYPTNTWWKKEIFDISHIAANQQNVSVRFSFGFGANNSLYYGWFVDDIKVTSDASDFIPPLIKDLSNLKGNVYSKSLLTIAAEIRDVNGINNSYIDYTLNGILQNRIFMQTLNGDTLYATFPQFNDGDKICYTINAEDASVNNNLNVQPAVRCRSFRYYYPLPIPYSNNFDSTIHLWSSDTYNNSVTTAWHLSINPYSSYSQPYCWLITENGSYDANIKTFLISPSFDFSQVIGAELKFFHKYNTETNDDITYLEYCIDGENWILLGSPNDPAATNWYMHYLYSNPEYFWSGNSNGWIESTYKLDFLDTINSPVKFRYVFESDGYNNSYLGHFIDDFRIEYQADYDLELLGFSFPKSSSCISNIDNLKLEIRNNGVQNIDFSTNPLTVNVFSTATNPTVFTPITINNSILNRGDTLSLLVSNNYDYSIDGIYSFNANITCNIDSIQNNDTINNYQVEKTSIFELPFTESFETFPLIALGTYNNWHTEYNLRYPSSFPDTAKWTVNNGVISSSSGPIRDHTTNTASGKYIYTNSYLGYYHDTSILISPCIHIPNANNSVDFTFWYHMFGSGMGDLYVDILYNGEWLNIDQILGQQQLAATDLWECDTINLDAYKGSNIKIRFRSAIGNSYRSNLAIDDIRINKVYDVDLEISDIVKTSNNNCSSNQETIEAIIINNGYETVDLSINNIVLNCESIGLNSFSFPPIIINSGIIASNDTMNIIISNSFDMYNTGTYTFNANLSTPNDSNNINDSIFNIDIINYDNSSPPYFYDFDNNRITSIEVNNGWESTPDSVYGNYSWTANSNVTPLYNSGPNTDHTLGNDLGIYYYLNVSSIYQSQSGSIISPCIDLNNIANPQLKFWYHMYGNDMGSLHIDIQENGIWNNDIYVINGQQHNSSYDPWSLATIDLNQFNTSIKIRIRGIKGTGSFGNIAIDDISVTSHLASDIGVVEIINPLDLGIEDSYQDIEVAVKNFGLNTITNYNINVIHNSNLLTPHTVNTSLIPNQIDTITINSINLNAKANKITAYTTLNNDINTYNDTAYLSYFGLPHISLYKNDFEDSTLTDWAVSGRAWEFGTPGGNVIDYPYSGDNVWMTELDDNYYNNTTYILTLPQSFYFTNIKGAYLSLYNWVQTIRYEEEFCVQYYIDNGYWETLGAVNDGLGVNWYNSTSYGNSSWSGKFTDWQSSVYDLSFLDSLSRPVKFRIYFESDNSSFLEQLDGCAIDNFAINIPKANIDVGVLEFINPSNNIIVSGSIQDVTIRVKNFGLDTISSLLLKYIDNNNNVIDEMWSGILYPDQTFDYTFNTPYTTPNTNFTLTALTYEINDNYDFNDTLKMNLQIPIGINDETQYNLSLGNCSPNPVTNSAIIPIEINQSGIVKFDIYNNLGQIVYTKEYNFDAGENQIEFTTENFASGVYCYMLTFKNSTSSGKFNKN